MGFGPRFRSERARCLAQVKRTTVFATLYLWKGMVGGRLARRAECHVSSRLRAVRPQERSKGE